MLPQYAMSYHILFTNNNGISLVKQLVSDSFPKIPFLKPASLDPLAPMVWNQVFLEIVVEIEKTEVCLHKVYWGAIGNNACKGVREGLAGEIHLWYICPRDLSQSHRELWKWDRPLKLSRTEARSLGWVSGFKLSPGRGLALNEVSLTAYHSIHSTAFLCIS